MSIDLAPFIHPADFAQLFIERDAAAHKGSFGSVAIVGGASSMMGAAVLASRAALKTGAGRVYVAALDERASLGYDPMQPELMWRSLATLGTLADQITAWGLGCGLGQSSQAFAAIKTVFQTRGPSPLVVDADALNAIAYGNVAPHWGSGVVVLTPHPAEAARLLDISTEAVQADRLAAAQRLAKRFQAWIVLKGQHTVMASPEGQCRRNPTGNVGLASAGTGDVLTGVITSLLGQGFTASVAVSAGVWLHGTACEALTHKIGGPIGLTASELIDAIRDLRNQSPG
jgi:ADP-dependent NAD(P)H-hydrate dehydratase